MLKRFRKHLKGVMTYTRLASDSRHIFFQNVQNESLLATDVAWRVAAKSPNQSFRNWFEEFKDRLSRIADAEDRFSQGIAIRREIVSNCKASITAITCFDDEWTNEERAIICGILVPDTNRDDQHNELFMMLCNSALSVSILRHISGAHFNDARPNDWFDFFKAAFQSYLRACCKSAIASRKGDDDEAQSFSLVAEVNEKLVAQLELKIYAGDNWNYDKEQLDAQWKAEERKREQHAESKKRPKQRFVTTAQIDDLSKYIRERLGRVLKGELYAPSDESGQINPNPYRALDVDAGLMLIAMSECVEDDDAALMAVKSAVTSMLNDVGTAAEPLEYEMALPAFLRDQFREHDKHGWLPHLAPVITSLLFNVIGHVDEMHDIHDSYPDLVSDNMESLLTHADEIVGDLRVKLALAITPDMLEVLHKTKQIFGWDLGEYRPRSYERKNC